MVGTVQTRQIWKYNINILFPRQNEGKENVGLVLKKCVRNFGLKRCLDDIVWTCVGGGRINISTLCQTVNVLLFLRGHNVTYS
jgi:hypothetical protein